MRIKRLFIVAAAWCAVSTIAWADRLILKDGTVLSGTVIRQSDGYWIKTPDGDSRVVPNAEVASLDNGQAPPSAAAHSGAFGVVKARADAADTADVAVALWQAFIDHNETSPDLAAAQAELGRWQALAAAGAEKINGRWISGDDLKTLKANAAQLASDGSKLLASHQTLRGLAKFQEAAKLYPNSTRINFIVGNLAMDQQQYDDALRYFQINVHLRPNSAEALADLGVAMAFKRQWPAAISTLEKAVQIEDSKEIAQDLVDALALAPPALRNSENFRTAMKSASLLADRYSIAAANTTFVLLPVETKAGALPDAGGHGMWSGTGFIISPEGLILTNRHVAKDSKHLVVVMGNSQLPAEVVKIDANQDLALIRIKTSQKLPFVQLSQRDVPDIGAECTVLGFPLIDRLGADLKVTRGIVSSARHAETDTADVMVDAKVNPGNSGGPILDHYGNVMAIVCMKSLSSATEDSYGIGISAGHIRQFLSDNNIVSVPGTGTVEMDTEHVVARDKSAVVCILATQE